VLVSSFDHELLRTFRQLDPHTRVAPLFDRWSRRTWAIATGLRAWSINLSRRVATATHLAAAGSRGLRSFVYTVNDLEEARRLIVLGATGVFTDYPDRITRDALTVRARG
jgi:glycerophosphoryl diester phosphodiesterase